jgi:cytochrome P450
VQYGVNRYSICDPSSLKIIYGPGSQFPKSTWYSSWTNPGSWSIFADQDIKRHARGRSLFQATYSMSSLVHYEPFVDQGAELFEQRLREMAERNDTVDMRHWFQCYAFDIIGSITYGKRFGFLNEGVDIESLMSVLDGHLIYASLAGLVPSLHPFLFALKNWWAGKKGSGRQYLLRFTLQQMKEHQDDAAKVDDAEEHDGPLAFVSKFMAKHADDPAKFTQAHIVASCISNIVAGSDTTGISLSATLYYLLRTPRCLESLRSEIDACRSKGQLSDQPTFKETQQMPYLQAVIKEAMRMHPATGLPLERVVPPGGAEIAGRRFPEGSIVGVNTWVEHRNPSIFGDDADVFRPERWLVDDAEALSFMNRHFMPVSLCSFPSWLSR